MVQLARRRHLKHSAYDRARYAEVLLSFLAERATSLDDTGASANFTYSGIAVGAVAATGTLTGTTIAANNTVTIGDIEYTFVAALSTGPTVPYEVVVGVSDSASIDNLIAAINGGDGIGVTYSLGTVAHPVVAASAGDGDTMDVEAEEVGVAGNIAVDANLTSGGWGEGIEALADGADAIPATGVMTSNAHGYVTGDGPFLISSTVTLPSGIIAGELYWVNRINANTFTLSGGKRGGDICIPLDVGSGTLSMTKADTESAFFAYLKQNSLEVVRNATDVDDL